MSFIFNLNGVSVLVMVGFKLHTYRDARNLPHDSLEYSELKNGGLLNKDQLPAALGFLTVADAAKIQQQQPEVRNIFNIYNLANHMTRTIGYTIFRYVYHVIA